MFLPYHRALPPAKTSFPPRLTGGSPDVAALCSPPPSCRVCCDAVKYCHHFMVTQFINSRPNALEIIKNKPHASTYVYTEITVHICINTYVNIICTHICMCVGSACLFIFNVRHLFDVAFSTISHVLRRLFDTCAYLFSIIHTYLCMCVDMYNTYTYIYIYK